MSETSVTEPGKNTLVLTVRQIEKAGSLYLKRHGYSRPMEILAASRLSSILTSDRRELAEVKLRGMRALSRFKTDTTAPP